MIDRAYIELIAPLLLEDLRAEARREALAGLTRRSRGPGRMATLALWLGGLLIEAGCCLDAVGRSRVRAMPLTLVPSPCSSGK